jgi:hypothetical protein
MRLRLKLQLPRALSSTLSRGETCAAAPRRRAAHAPCLMPCLEGEVDACSVCARVCALVRSPMCGEQGAEGVAGESPGGAHGRLDGRAWERLGVSAGGLHGAMQTDGRTDCANWGPWRGHGGRGAVGWGWGGAGPRWHGWRLGTLAHTGTGRPGAGIDEPPCVAAPTLPYSGVAALATGGLLRSRMRTGDGAVSACRHVTWGSQPHRPYRYVEGPGASRSREGAGLRRHDERTARSKAQDGRGNGKTRCEIATVSAEACGLRRSRPVGCVADGSPSAFRAHAANRCVASVRRRSKERCAWAGETSTLRRRT